MQRVDINNVQSHSWRVVSHALFFSLDFIACLPKPLPPSRSPLRRA